MEDGEYKNCEEDKTVLTFPKNVGKLRELFEKEFAGESSASFDFRIQYSVFHLEETTAKYETWVMKCIFDTNEEGLYTVGNVEYSEKNKIKFRSYKGNYPERTITQIGDMRGQSNDKKLYIIDLYPDFEPKKYKGVVSTRGHVYHRYLIDLVRNID